MSKIDLLADVFNTSHKKNYATGKFETVDPIDESVIAEDTYSVISVYGDADIAVSDPSDADKPEDNQIEVYSDPDEDDYLEDEITIKRNIKTIIENGMDLMEDLCENVRDSEQPKSFEYAAVFMKSLVEMNEKLLDVHDRKKKRKSMAKPQESTGNISQVNNNIHIYETSPVNILKEIKGKKGK